MQKILFTSFVLISFFSLFSTASKTFNINESQLNSIENKFGIQGKNRVEEWDAMLESSKDETTLNKIKNVNDFFNKITYKTDLSHWRQKDYWATPFEFMGSGAGDCEDYAIAKYLALEYLGVPTSKMFLSYVRVKSSNEAHMVLTYFETPSSEPLVLDNLRKTIQPASKRDDLIPVFNFNPNILKGEKTAAHRKWDTLIKDYKGKKI